MSGSITCSSATMSLALSEPAPPLSVSQPQTQPSVYQPDAYALSDYPTYEHCYDTAKQYLASAPLKPSKDVSSPPLISSTSNASSTKSAIADKTRRGSSLSGSSLGSAPREYENGQGRRRKRRSKTDLVGVPLTVTRRRSRKAYPCPTPGCSKSYLNPNGLKYHQEKGTCKIEFPVAPGLEAAAAAVDDKSPPPPSTRAPLPQPQPQWGY
ncbi:hypothetical protein C0995_012068 [Termitomyces sp. Mi166|nr:hypothetical protein C0995_012068 [Termitomyces sp. Mi166\